MFVGVVIMIGNIVTSYMVGTDMTLFPGKKVMVNVALKAVNVNNLHGLKRFHITEILYRVLHH